jgi:hypothetical protein
MNEEAFALRESDSRGPTCVDLKRIVLDQVACFSQQGR